MKLLPIGSMCYDPLPKWDDHPSSALQVVARNPQGEMEVGPTAAFGNSDKMWFPIETTLPETNSSHLKMDGWNTSSFPFGARRIFRGHVFRECIRLGSKKLEESKCKKHSGCQKFTRWVALHPVHSPNLALRSLVETGHVCVRGMPISSGPMSGFCGADWKTLQEYMVVQFTRWYPPEN